MPPARSVLSTSAPVPTETLGRQDEAAALYRRILEKDSATALVWTNLGNAEAALGRRTEAEHAYRQALMLDPHNRDALNNLAWLLLEEGQRLGEAEELATRAVEAAGPDQHLVLDTLGRVLRARGRCGEAIEVFTRAIAAAPPASPEGSWLHLGLGLSQSACGRVEEPRKSLERTLSEGADEELRRAAEAALEALASTSR